MTRIVAAFLALALLAPQANAAGMMGPMTDYKPGRLKLGPVSISPYYGITTAYESNIYAVPKDQANGARQGGGVLSSMITNNNFGANFKLPVSGMHSFDGGMDFTSVLYSKQAKTNDYIGFGGKLGYNYKGPMGISGRLSDSYNNTADAAFSELAGQRSQRWANTIGASVGYNPDGGHLVAGGSFDHTTDKYVDGLSFGPLLNRYTQTFGVTGGYKVQPKTKVYLGYRRQIIHYTGRSAGVNGGDKNNKSHFFDLGVEGQIAPKLTGNIQAGYQLKDYDQAQSFAITKTGFAVRDAQRKAYTQAWVASSNLTWKPMERCTWMLALSRSLNESTYGSNRYSISNNANLSVSHVFPHKLTGRIKAGVQIDKYPEAFNATIDAPVNNRRDDTYTQGAGVGYKLQDWIDLGLDYGHTKRSSISSDQFNYESHVTMLSAKLTF